MIAINMDSDGIMNTLEVLFVKKRFTYNMKFARSNLN